jgi:hypothetical protein
MHPTGGWSGDTNPWDATEFLLALLSQLSADPSDDAGRALMQLAQSPKLLTYRDDIKHAGAQQAILAIDRQFHSPTWKETLEALGNGSPANIADLQALVMAHLADLRPHIAAGNLDSYKRFWSENRHGKITSPKNEESCRDALVELLRPRLAPHKIRVEPEGHLAKDKRADIAIFGPGMKLVVELKRDYHADVWTAIREQLDRFYTRDPEAQGFGVYGVFWYGSRRPKPVRKLAPNKLAPTSAADMQKQLESLRDVARNKKIKIFVMDVSGELQSGVAKPKQSKGRREQAKTAKERAKTGAKKNAKKASKKNGKYTSKDSSRAGKPGRASGTSRRRKRR